MFLEWENNSGKLQIISGNNFVAPLSKTTMSYLKFDNTKRSLYPIGKNASKLKTG